MLVDHCTKYSVRVIMRHPPRMASNVIQGENKWVDQLIQNFSYEGAQMLQ